MVVRELSVEASGGLVEMVAQVELSDTSWPDGLLFEHLPIGKRLWLRRIALGLSQQEVVQRMGVPAYERARVSLIEHDHQCRENERSQLSLARWQRLVDAYHRVLTEEEQARDVPYLMRYPF